MKHKVRMRNRKRKTKTESKLKKQTRKQKPKYENIKWNTKTEGEIRNTKSEIRKHKAIYKKI